VNRTFEFYEFAGTIVPGALVLLGFFWLFPEARALMDNGVSVGKLGIFIIVAYAAGQLVQGIGNGIEWLWWRIRGGWPSHRVLAGKLLSADQHKRVMNALRTDKKVTAAALKSSSECWAIVREVYSVVAAAGRAGRVDTFNGNYGLMRGLAAALLVLLIASIVTAKGVLVVGILLTLFALAIQRMDRFGRHYARELFIQYLLV
jgi:hypothetical protein